MRRLKNNLLIDDAAHSGEQPHVERSRTATRTPPDDVVPRRRWHPLPWRAHGSHRALPWWQRFPMDLVTDVLWPGQLDVTVVSTAEQARATAVPTIDADELTDRARRFGYATDVQEPQHDP